MAPFDNPALAAAKIRIKQINAKGGVDGRKFVDQDLRHAEQQRREGEVVRAQPAAARRRALIVHDVRRRTSPRRSCRRRSSRGSSRSLHASAPTRWGRSASASRASCAFSFGNVAQDEGSAMAQYAIKRGLEDGRPRRRNTLLVYFKNVVQAFDKRFTPARREGGRPRELRHRREQRQHRRQPAELAQGCGLRDLDGVRRAAGVRVRLPLAATTTHRSSTPGPVTGPTGTRQPEGDELLLRHVRVGRSATTRARTCAR